MHNEMIDNLDFKLERGAMMCKSSNLKKSAKKSSGFKMPSMPSMPSMSSFSSIFGGFGGSKPKASAAPEQSSENLYSGVQKYTSARKAVMKENNVF